MDHNINAPSTGDPCSQSIFFSFLRKIMPTAPIARIRMITAMTVPLMDGTSISEDITLTTC